MSEAPLCSLDVGVPPPPGEFSNGKTAAGARVPPIAAENERLEEGSRVELEGPVRDMNLTGQRTDGERLIAMPGSRRVNVKMSDISPAGDPDADVVQREATAAVPLKGPDGPPSRAMIEAHNLTHLPAVPWCKICVQATTARYRACKWTFSSFLVLLFGVLKHMPRPLC